MNDRRAQRDSEKERATAEQKSRQAEAEREGGRRETGDDQLEVGREEVR